MDLNASRRYYHFLGKAAWRVKNVQGAIDVVKALPNEKIYIWAVIGLILKWVCVLRLLRKPVLREW